MHLQFQHTPNAEPTKVIHILNWHYVSRDTFADDLKSSTGKPLTDDQIKKEYLEFRVDIREIQNQQMDLLHVGAAASLAMSGDRGP